MVMNLLYGLWRWSCKHPRLWRPLWSGYEVLRHENQLTTRVKGPVLEPCWVAGGPLPARSPGTLATRCCLLENLQLITYYLLSTTRLNKEESLISLEGGISLDLSTLSNYTKVT